MDSWAFFNESGNEINRGWQGSEDQARAQARKYAQDQSTPVEFIRESLLGLVRASDLAIDSPEGEWVEPTEQVDGRLTRREANERFPEAMAMLSVLNVGAVHRFEVRAGRFYCQQFEQDPARSFVWNADAHAWDPDDGKAELRAKINEAGEKVRAKWAIDVAQRSDFGGKVEWPEWPTPFDAVAGELLELAEKHWWKFEKLRLGTDTLEVITEDQGGHAFIGLRVVLCDSDENLVALCFAALRALESCVLTNVDEAMRAIDASTKAAPSAQASLDFLRGIVLACNARIQAIGALNR